MRDVRVYMTVRHLVADWGGRYLPKPVVNTAEAIARRLGVWGKVVGVNLGDIVTVIARKETG